MKEIPSPEYKQNEVYQTPEIPVPDHLKEQGWTGMLSVTVLENEIDAKKVYTLRVNGNFNAGVDGMNLLPTLCEVQGSLEDAKRAAQIMLDDNANWHDINKYN